MLRLKIELNKLFSAIEKSQDKLGESQKVFDLIIMSEEITFDDLREKGITPDKLLSMVEDGEVEELFNRLERGAHIIGNLSSSVDEYRTVTRRRRLF